MVRPRVPDGTVWEVVGGCAKGGILVRSAKSISSVQLPMRLSTGALVRSIEHDTDEKRLHYELLVGAGPASGWVTTTVQNKDLLVKTEKHLPAAPAETKARFLCSPAELEEALPALRWYKQQLEQTGSKDYELQENAKGHSTDTWRFQQLIAQNEARPVPPLDIAVDAHLCDDSAAPETAELQEIGSSGPPSPVVKIRSMMKIRQFRQPANVGTGARHRGCHQPRFPSAGSIDNAHCAQANDMTPSLEPGGAVGESAPHTQSCSAHVQTFRLVEEPEDQERLVCTHCQLPIGDWAYFGASGKRDLLHSECRAQLILRLEQEEDKNRWQKDAAWKRARREEYAIGWKVERIPSNTRLARALTCCDVPHSMYCLVMDTASRTVRVAPTIDPATSVNLEYLSVALQVRRSEGREPLFSLDPVDSSPDSVDKRTDIMQRKRFEPAWLAGTTVGDVMFQADYHLKELSMGEHEQPVLGMKSCFDLAEAEGFDKEWRAREWFVVKQAGLYLSDGSVLTPHVKMGVEAREQVHGPKGMEDARLTRRDHPLVKYAEAFTRNFDLIAERKSVIYHLRELAKASVLAKFLVDDEVVLEESWFTLAGERKEAGAMEVPQLWNERRYSKIRVKDGRLMDAEQGIVPSVHGVYGGVAFQLDQVPTMQAARLPRAGATVAARALALAGGGKARPFGEVAGVPKGVDLSLDNFDLSTPTLLPQQQSGCAGSCAALSMVASAAYGKAFWFSMACSSGSVFKAEDRQFFRSLFNPYLSDRHGEGAQFVPPQTSFGYIQRLRRLLDKEEELRQQRQSKFFSKDFLVDSAGSLYPSSWESSIAIAQEQVRQGPHTGHSKKGWSPSGALTANLQLVLKTAVPVFDKSTEDGMRFRIYQTGSLELRTTQEHDGKEVIGVVFSDSASPQTCTYTVDQELNYNERVVKATEYVESIMAGTQRSGDGLRLPCQYFVVFLTEPGNVIVTEQLEAGTTTWAENPVNLEARISQAKVTGCTGCQAACIDVRDLRAFRAAAGRYTVQADSAAERRRYARGALRIAEPAEQKHWVALAESQRRAAACLGVETASGWDYRAAPVWRLSWWDMTEQERGAAKSLGIDEDSWDRVANQAPGLCEMSHEQMHKCEARDNGIAARG